MKVSIDQLVDKLERQVKKYRERRIVEPRRHTEHNGDTPAP
jgi:ribosome-associated translation inhibitor RaiA